MSLSDNFQGNTYGQNIYSQLVIFLFSKKMLFFVYLSYKLSVMQGDLTGQGSHVPEIGGKNKFPAPSFSFFPQIFALDSLLEPFYTVFPRYYFFLSNEMYTLK